MYKIKYLYQIVCISGIALCVVIDLVSVILTFFCLF